MVVKIMRWRQRPPPESKKYEVRLVVRSLHGLDLAGEGAEKDRKLVAEVRWKGPKLPLMSSLRRVSVKRNFTREENLGEDGAVSWDEEFETLCSMTACKENDFHPWEIGFTVFNATVQGSKSKAHVLGTALLNLAEYASAMEHKDFELNIPLIAPGGAAGSPHFLRINLSLVEMRTAQETAEFVKGSTPFTSPSQLPETVSSEKYELSALKAGLQKVKIITELVSSRRAKKACREVEGSEGQGSGPSEDGEYNYPVSSDSLDDSEEDDTEESKEDSTGIRKSFSYGTLAYANYAGGSFYSSARIISGNEDWVYYANRKSDVGSVPVEDSFGLVSEELQSHNSRRSILPWRKRKLSFRSPKTKGEPLLKKAYAEEGGDDIDFDRRQLSSDESQSLGRHKADEDSSVNSSLVSEFGDDNFAVGIWEQKDIVSRDGQMKLQTEVFFASIDQRSERAAGEGACTVLVAVIADWFQMNNELMPIKSQFDSLIRDGSLEWRNLCENEGYKERFPDKHFDLETVLEAKIRALSVVPGKSFIGFFHPEGVGEGRFNFLEGSLSFDDIWNEISRDESWPRIYIVSWNDHFFILRVEAEAYYIIDTLGERLYEGCNQAYILKFDSKTTIAKLPTEPSKDEPASAAATASDTEVPAKSELPIEASNDSEAEVVVCQGKESCKDYIKSFLAAIPIRELQADIQKGLMASTPVHHRLQIELHYVQTSQPSTTSAAGAAS